MKINGTFITREIAGECMLIPTGSTAESINGMITLNDSALFIWSRIESAGSIEEIINAVCEEFEVDRSTAEKDVSGFLHELNVYGFITPTNADKNW